MYNGGMIELQRSTDKEKWDDYVLENGGHPLQLWGWGQLKSAHGWRADRMFAFMDEEIVGAAQLLIRKLPWPLKSIVYVPRGPIGNIEYRLQTLAALAEYAKRQYSAVTISIEPDATEYDVPKGWVVSKNKILPARTIILDLKKDESQLLTDMVKKTRQYIRKSAAEDIKIKSVRSRAELEKCLAVYHQTSERAKFSLHDDRYYYDAFTIMGDHSPVFAAYVGDQPIAFLWLAVSADTSYELYGGMNDLGQQLRANYALKWYAIRKTKEWGLTRYDFGGLINDGISTFKKSWTTEETQLAGTFDKPLSPWYGLWSRGLPTAKSLVRKLKPRR